jgi:hypothetical protein
MARPSLYWLDEKNSVEKEVEMKRTAIILVIVVALSGLGGAVYAAQDSLPGDTLYSVKLGIEDATMMLGGDDVARAERALNFATKRVREMLTLTERERLGDLGVSADKYCCAMNMSLVRMEAALDNGGPDADDITQLMAEAMAQHVPVLDGVYNVTPDEAKPYRQQYRSEWSNGYRNTPEGGKAGRGKAGRSNNGVYSVAPCKRR